MNLARMLIVAMATTILFGCAAIPPQQDGEQELVAGIKNYEEGKDGDAARSIQASLYLGLNESNQIRAHKYLAFIYCASGREAQCRVEFRRVLAIDPSFELRPAEAGHPIWGAVFRGVKDQR